MSEERQSITTPKRRVKKSNGAASPSSEKSSVDTIVLNKGRRTSSGLQQRFVDVLGWGIFGCWAIGFGVDMINIFPEWDLPAGIWGLMTIVSGAAFVAQAIKKPGDEG